ncbi:Ty3b-i, partial [Fragariocoptes setiger]
MVIDAIIADDEKILPENIEDWQNKCLKVANYNALCEQASINSAKRMLENGLLYLPQAKRQTFLTSAHKSWSCGHGGIAATLQRLNGYYWPDMTNGVKNHVRACIRCEQCKRERGPQPALMGSFFASRPFETVSIDFVVEMPLTTNRNRAILIAVDHFSRFVEAKATVDRKTATVEKFLIDQIFACHGSPRAILSDNALEFRSQLVRDIAAIMGKQSYASAYHHTRSPIVERANQTLTEKLALITDTNERSHWDEKLQLAVFATNTSHHE